MMTMTVVYSLDFVEGAGEVNCQELVGLVGSWRVRDRPAGSLVGSLLIWHLS